MRDDHDHGTALSRRGFLVTGSTLLASVGLAGVTQGRASAAPAQPGKTDLALYRPVHVSSTAYAPTPGHFVVDRMARRNVQGSGWRAAVGGTQWVAVDLQGSCRVESVVLVFEAAEGDVVFKPGEDTNNPRRDTTGWEVLSSYATEFRVEVSDDGRSWKSVHDGSTKTGGVVEVVLDEAVTTRWVRLVGTKQSNPNPLGLNSFQVYGTARGRRADVTGWTDWTSGARRVPALRVERDGTVPVESGWNVTLQEFAGTGDGAVVSADGVDTSRWLRARVPGTILASLVEEGHLPDPVEGFNNLRAPEALGKNSWWYRRVFRLPHRFPERGHDRVWLELDGINHRAEIWLDGVKVGELEHPSARGAFDVSAQLGRGGEHVLAVRIDPMPFPGSPGDRGDDGQPYHDAGSFMIMRNAPTYLAVTGWDWMPAVRDRVMGIWNHVRLRSTRAAVVGDPLVETSLPNLPDVSRADVTVTVPVRNAASSQQKVRVRAALGRVRVEKDVDVDGGKTVDVVFSPKEFSELRLTDPELWWPNGYGEPTLHDLDVVAEVDGARSDRRTLRVGLRQTKYESENPIKFEPGANRVQQVVELERQQARFVRIQAGRRATGYGVSLWTLSIVDKQNPTVDLARGAQASASSVDSPDRSPEKAVDGDPNTRWSSSYNDDQYIQVDLGKAASFDQITLVWEVAYAKTFKVQVSADGDKWTDVKAVNNAPTQLKISVNGVPVMCRGGNWGWDELLRRMLDGRMDAVVEYHRDMNFTMIRNWLGSSNREEFYARCDENGLLVWNDFWNAWFLDPPDHALYLRHVRDTILRYRSHPSIVVWCGANEGTPSGEVDKGARQAVAEVHPDVLYVSNSAADIVSGSGPYAWIDPALYFSAETYAQDTFGFHTEIGIPTVPVAESMRNLVGDEKGWPIDTVWAYHDWATRGGQYPQSYKAAIDERLGESHSLEEFCTKAQLVNFESMRAMFEAWNANLWQDATGLLLWMSNPAWHSVVWQTYDYDLDVNGTYYGAKTGCEPHHVQADPRNWNVIAVNHTRDALRGAVVEADVLDLKGRPLADKRWKTVDLMASSTAAAFTVDPLAGTEHPLHLVRLRLANADGDTLSENTYWRHTQPKDLQALNELSGASLRLTGSRVTDWHGRLSLTVTVHNRGNVVAPMVRLALRHRRSKDRVLPATYSDNYLWLLPGERRRVTISCPRQGGHPSDLEVTAQGYRTSLVSNHGHG
ncbi:discoidin domain-containing protein [Actinomadura meridiana]|uniref:Discoidin domain-containing protein n=1 Tax=Actinomadura meridiana TaxID=559626 RepID=A0ABP8BRV0_9ACTN